MLRTCAYFFEDDEGIIHAGAYTQGAPVICEDLFDRDQGHLMGKVKPTTVTCLFCAMVKHGG